MAIQALKSKTLFFIVLVVSIAISLLLLYEHEVLALGGKVGLGVCNLGEMINCANVISSAWSSFLGVSLAAWGLFFYLFVGSLLIIRTNNENFQQATHFFITVLYAIAVVVSIVLLGISKFLIGAFCPLCLSLYLLNIFSFILLYKTVASNGLRAGFRNFNQVIFKGSFWQFRDESTEKGFSLLTLIKVLILCATLTLLPALLMKIFVSQTLVSEVRENVSSWPKQGRLKMIAPAPGLVEDLVKGNKRASIQIVEFADLQCPFCRLFYLELDDLVRKYPGRVNVVFKNFPLDSSCNIAVPGPMHPEACQLAHAFRCLSEQDLFWAAMDVLATIDTESSQSALDSEATAVVSSDLEKTLAHLDYDREAFEQCQKSERYWPKITDDIKQGLALGVDGTPSVWVNGKPFKGIKQGGLERLIDRIISEKGKDGQ